MRIRGLTKCTSCDSVVSVIVCAHRKHSLPLQLLMFHVRCTALWKLKCYLILFVSDLMTTRTHQGWLKSNSRQLSSLLADVVNVYWQLHTYLIAEVCFANEVLLHTARTVIFVKPVSSFFCVLPLRYNRTSKSATGPRINLWGFDTFTHKISMTSKLMKFLH